MRHHRPATFVALLCIAFTARPGRAIDAEPALLHAFLRLGVVEQTLTNVEELARKAPESEAGAVREAAAAWGARQRGEIGASLSAALGDAARERFVRFVEAFTAAEANADAGVLAEFMVALDLDAPVASYGSLRATVLHKFLMRDLEAAAAFLGDVHTWIDLRGRMRDAPPLDDWLNRAAPSGTAPPPPAPDRPRRTGNALRDAEAPAGGPTDVSRATSPNPRDAFGASRTERHAAALAEARAGMQQVAAERRSEEDALAARKLAEAQAAADAARKQAQTLAAAEAEALEQRRNSWSAKLKSVLTATISATGGAFLGGVGARVGESAATAVFGEGPIAVAPVQAQPVVAPVVGP